MRYVTINKCDYPVKLGMIAMRNIGKYEGGFSEIVACLQSDNEAIREDSMFKITHEMIKNGIAMLEFEKGEDAPFLPEIKSPEHIEALLSIKEGIDLYDVIIRTIIEDSKTTIETENEAEGECMGNSQATQGV